VIAALDPGALEQRAAGKTMTYKIDELPDPFKVGTAPVTEEAPAPLPAPEAVAPAEEQPRLPPPLPPVAGPPRPPPLPADAGEAQASAVSVGETRETDETPRADEPDLPPGGDVPDLLGGVNLNTAPFDQLMTLDGVTPLVARHIVEYREAHGPFSSIFELRRVPRVGRGTFMRITGMPYSRTGRHRREKLARLLDLPVRSVAHLPSVVRAVVTRPGFMGCAISDDEGLVLAEDGVGERAEALGAIIPRMLRQMSENMAELNEEGLQSVTIRIKGRMHTVIACGHIYLTALHEANRLTMTHFNLLERLSRELEWLLSYRGYVGPASAGS